MIMDDNHIIGLGREAKCPVCGKIFIIPPENVYKLLISNKRVDYCSYTCFRTAQKKQEKGKKYKIKL